MRPVMAGCMCPRREKNSRFDPAFERGEVNRNTSRGAPESLLFPILVFTTPCVHLAFPRKRGNRTSAAYLEKVNLQSKRMDPMSQDIALRANNAEIC